MKNIIKRLLGLILLIVTLNPIPTGYAAVQPQTLTPGEKAATLLNQLSPEERVGQLFLCTFKDTDVGVETPIYNLLTNYHIGGVILLASNDNFVTGENSLERLLSMNRELQLDQWAASQKNQSSPTTGTPGISQFIPLFIGTIQEGDGYPNDQIINGMTPLPNEMAMGATWNPSLVENVGQVLGKELSILGFNLILGPALDVLETPRPEGRIDLGTRAFGSDPFWVSVLGRVYIKGIHEGSNNKLAVVAKHFPGNGGSDRSPEEEVATVRKSLEQLKNFDLVPFFAVTGDAQSTEETTDALLASHIRYQGFQENIRATTRPISFDPQAFSLLMHLPALANWREKGGVVISDNLGSQAVRRFYELSGQTYDARRVTLNAFLAGNDMLYLGDITTVDDTDTYTAVTRVLDFFAQKYHEDPAFAQQVDVSVLRILTLKYKLNPAFNLDNVIPPLSGLQDVGTSSQVTFDVARQAATLISPSAAELYDTIPDPPKVTEKITFITDIRSAQQCNTCPIQPVFSVDGFEQAVKRLYGPQAGGQIWPANISSYSFSDLLKLLDKDPNAPPVESAIKQSQWLVFAMLDINDTVPTSLALKRFLSERPDLIQHRHLIVFAFNAPNFLDATNISKLSAYYAMYSKNPIFIDVASRVLFRELIPNGALPVSVPGIGYDIINATSPDPDQVMPLYLVIPGATQPLTTTTETPIPTQIPQFKVGDLITVKTGVILDHNGHPVPDGTPVQFISTVSGETSFPQSEVTNGGIATTMLKLTNSGSWVIRVESEPAKNSDVLQLEIPAVNGENITITPSPVPTETPAPTHTPTIIAITQEPLQPPTDQLKFTDWLIAFFVSLLMGYSTYRLSTTIGSGRWGLRGTFLAMIGGLFAYCYLALHLPGSVYIIDNFTAWGVFFISLLGSVLGIGITWGWRAVNVQSTKKS
jgi:beta-N-acetylhexosaminidase